MRVLTHRIAMMVSLAAAALALAARADADPIPLVSGVIEYSRGSEAQFNATAADGSRIRGDFGNAVYGVWNPNQFCLACVPGTAIDFSESFSGAFGDEERNASGSIRVGDAEYWIDSLVFQITAGRLPLPDSSNALVRLSSPFSFQGILAGTTLEGAARTFSFVGTGTATSRYIGNEWFTTTYQFAAATPEPGTLLLIGGPALVAILRRRTRGGIAG